MHARVARIWFAFLSVCGCAGSTFVGTWERDASTETEQGLIRLELVADGGLGYRSERYSTVDAGMQSAGCATLATGSGSWLEASEGGTTQTLRLSFTGSSVRSGCEKNDLNVEQSLMSDVMFLARVQDNILSLSPIADGGPSQPALNYRRTP